MAVSIVFKGKRLVQRDTATFDHMLKRRVSFVRFLEVDRNIDFPFSGADWDRMTRLSSEVVNLSPDSIVVHSNDFRAALLQNGRSVPTVFVQGGDPVGSGFVESLARPGGNLTGFTSFEAAIGGKWLEALKDINREGRFFALGGRGA